MGSRRKSARELRLRLIGRFMFCLVWASEADSQTQFSTLGLLSRSTLKSAAHRQWFWLANMANEAR
ncbi:hypothetical protein BDW69DRAFT_168697 [Aspergillus filifer]